MRVIKREMGWKEWSTWLKGGAIFGAIMGLFSYVYVHFLDSLITYQLLLSPTSWGVRYIHDFLLIKTTIGTLSENLRIPFVEFLIPAVFYFVVGAALGEVNEMFKKRNAVCWKRVFALGAVLFGGAGALATLGALTDHSDGFAVFHYVGNLVITTVIIVVGLIFRLIIGKINK